VDQALRDVERVRGVKARSEVRQVVVPREELAARVRAHVRADVPKEAIAAEAEEQKLLGLFPVGGDYEASVYATLGLGITAYYEPLDRTMYLASDISAEEARATLSHELVHALADERWDLRARSAFVRGDDDHDEAVSALSEGEATVVADMLAEGQGSPLPPSGSALARAIRAPYIYGAEFVRSLVRRGGWNEVDEAWRTAPLTTEHILHSDKWRLREPEEPIAVPPPPHPGMVLTEANVYGELGLLLFFEEWMGAVTARRAAAGWGGDRLALYAEGDDRAMAWHLRFDDASPLAADAFSLRAMSALSRIAPDMGHLATAGDDRFCVERASNGPLAVLRKGRDLLVGAGTVATASAGAWRARMTCDAALAWLASVPEGAQSAGIEGRAANPNGSLPSASYSTSRLPTSDR
jgi:hypothetical protein